MSLRSSATSAAGRRWRRSPSAIRGGLRCTTATRSRPTGAALSAGAKAKPVIAANLPYNIATMLLVGWLETEPWPPWWDRMVLMFQKEVAERIVAAPGGKAYGRLAVIAQWRTRARLVFTLQPGGVHAAAQGRLGGGGVRSPIERPSPECSVKTLGPVTAAAFGQRRKMLRQSLKALRADPEALLRRRRHRSDLARRGAHGARLRAARLCVGAVPFPLAACGVRGGGNSPARVAAPHPDPLPTLKKNGERETAHRSARMPRTKAARPVWRSRLRRSAARMAERPR